MEEITHIDHRATHSTHEADRTARVLLARVYQLLADSQAADKPHPGSVHPDVILPAEPVLTQETQR